MVAEVEGLGKLATLVRFGADPLTAVTNTKGFGRGDQR